MVIKDEWFSKRVIEIKELVESYNNEESVKKILSIIDDIEKATIMKILNLPINKKCPFCNKCGHLNYTYRSNKLLFGVGCETSKCYGKFITDKAMFETPEEAVENWNNRS